MKKFLRYKIIVVLLLAFTISCRKEVTPNQPPPPGNSDYVRKQVSFSLNEVGNLSVPRIPAIAAAGNKIVFAGGLFSMDASAGWTNYASTDAVDIYDVNAKTWSVAKLSSAREGIAAISCGSKIFFAGGNTPNGSTSAVDIYDVNTNSWSLEYLSDPRAGISAATIGNKVFFAGGVNNWWDLSSRIDIYDIATGQWTSAGLSQPCDDISSFINKNKVYFVANSYPNEGNIQSPSVDIYDNLTGTWSKETVPKGYYKLQGITAGNNFYWLYYSPNIIDIRNDEGSINSVTMYTPNVWTSRNADILFHNHSASVEIFNTESKLWSIGKLKEPLTRAAVVQLNNIIYLAGGMYDNNTFSAKVYQLDW